MPPGLMKSHMKKRKASDESEERHGSEEQEPPQLMVANRQRRSAAQKCHEIWESMKPGAKMGGMDVEEKRGQSPSPNNESGGVSTRTRARPTPKRAKNVTKDGMEMEGGDEVKTEMKQEITTGNNNGGDVGSSTAPEKPPQLTPISPTKSQLPLQPQHVIVSPSKRVVVSSSTISSTQIYQQHHTQPALKRDQLELIEREMDKHDQYDESSGHDELSDEEDEQMINGESPHRYMLDDPEDGDYLAHSAGSTGRGRGRGGGGRGRGRGGSRGSRGGGAGGGLGTGVVRGTGIRGRPRGSRGGGGGIMRGGGTMRVPRMPMFKSGAPHLSRGGIYSLQPAGGIVGELSARSMPNNVGGQPQSFVRVLRPAGMQIQGNYPMRSTVLSQQQQMAETNFVINRELENYRDRIVESSSVHEFNEIIDNLLAEYQRLVDDRAQLISGHREYVNHLKLSHQAAQDIKDNKIRYLEQTLEQLQQKLVAGFKQEQLRVVKQGTVEGSDGPQREGGGGSGDEGQAQIGAAANQQQQGIQQVIVGGNGQIMEPQDTEMIESEQNINRWQGGNGPVGQRIRIMGLGRGRQMGLPHQHQIGQPENHHRMVVGPNAPPYFDDEMDDEEEFEDDGGDSAEMDDELGAQVTI